MDKPAFIEKFLENIRNSFSFIKDKISNSKFGIWVSENKKLAIIVSSLFCLMIICVILLVVIESNKKEVVTTYQEELVLSNEPIIPDGPELPKDYTISREKRDRWTKEEADQWYSEPSEADMRGLEKANDIIINNILEAAP